MSSFPAGFHSSAVSPNWDDGVTLHNLHLLRVSVENFQKALLDVLLAYDGCKRVYIHQNWESRAQLLANISSCKDVFLKAELLSLLITEENMAYILQHK